jgi:hypothetical protein
MPFTCIKCNASFPKNQGLIAHLNRKRPCDLELAAKVLACAECGKRFTRHDSLLRHSRQSCTGADLDATQNARVARLEQQVEALTNLVAQSAGTAPNAMNAHTTIVQQNTNIINDSSVNLVNHVTISPWGSPLQLTDADVEAALATVPGLVGTPALPEVVAALMELVKRAHAPQAARNVHLNPKRTDQALALTTGGWAAMPLEEATAALFDGASASMAAARAPSMRQTIRASIPIQYQAERTDAVQMGLRPMGAHLLNVAPGGPGPLLIEATAATVVALDPARAVALLKAIPLRYSAPGALDPAWLAEITAAAGTPAGELVRALRQASAAGACGMAEWQEIMRFCR